MKAGKDYTGVSVAALIVNKKKEVLLVKRTLASKFDGGNWTLIVGEVNYGEPMADAIKRESMEEAGITVEILRPIELIEIFPMDTGVHWVGMDYLCMLAGGVLENKEPQIHERLEWFPLDKLPEPMGPSTKSTIREYIRQEKEMKQFPRLG